MLKKTITYTDYNGNQRTESFWFNLTKAEVTRMEMSVQGGMAEMIDRIIDAQDAGSLWVTRKNIAGPTTEAYSELFMELVTNVTAAAEFVNGIMPNDPEPKPALVADSNN